MRFHSRYLYIFATLFSFCSIVSVAMAEDREDDYGDRVKAYSGTKTVYVQKIVYETRVIIPPLWQEDTDNDRLVDAFDPDPTHNQKLYFRDTDRDGMPDIFDQLPRFDDFVINGPDDDANGIMDDYERTFSH